MVQAVSLMYDCTTSNAEVNKLSSLWNKFSDCYQPRQTKLEKEHFEKYNSCRENFLEFQQSWLESSSFAHLLSDQTRSNISSKELSEFDYMVSLVVASNSKQ
mmetsp:Transcript_45896/g.70204  ORF Transcript_45896/g.70204 Transcript_45896/m.70204 type:complete len:102 (+) Transcript_45896:345-650(+)